MAAPIVGLSTPIDGLCDTCKNRGLVLKLNNDTSTQESVSKYYCKVIDLLIFSEDKAEDDKYQQELDVIDITEPEGNILSVKSFVTNCTEYELDIVLRILAASYDAVTETIEVTAQIIGGDGSDNMELWLYDPAAGNILLDVSWGVSNITIAFSVVYSLLRPQNDYRLFVKMTTGGQRSNFYPLRYWIAAALLSVSYDIATDDITIVYSIFYTDNTESLLIYIDGVLYDPLLIAGNGEYQTLVFNYPLLNGDHDIFIQLAASAVDSNTLTFNIYVPIP